MGSDVTCSYVLPRRMHGRLEELHNIACKDSIRVVIEKMLPNVKIEFVSS